MSLGCINWCVEWKHRHRSWFQPLKLVTLRSNCPTILGLQILYTKLWITKPLFVYKSAYKYGSKGSNIALRGSVLRVSPTPNRSGRNLEDFNFARACGNASRVVYSLFSFSSCINVSFQRTFADTRCASCQLWRGLQWMEFCVTFPASCPSPRLKGTVSPYPGVLKLSTGFEKRGWESSS